MDESEKKLQGTLSDGQKIMIFHKNGGDIKVEATEISEGWRLIDENIQVSKGDYHMTIDHNKKDGGMYILPECIARIKSK